VRIVCRSNFTSAMLGPGAVSRIFAEKGALFVSRLFDVFLPSSSGLFSHASSLIQRTLQAHPDIVARTIGGLWAGVQGWEAGGMVPTPPPP
jgi:hypothetical protein